MKELKIILTIAILTAAAIYASMKNEEIHSIYKYKVYEADGRFQGYTNNEPDGSCIETDRATVCGSYVLYKNAYYKE